MPVITANDLKTQGVSAIEKALEAGDETTISVRGKPRFVVMDVAHYDRLREAEIYAAWQEARAAVAAGDFVAESAEAHIARLEKESGADGL